MNEWFRDFVHARQSYGENDVFDMDATGVFFVLFVAR